MLTAVLFFFLAFVGIFHFSLCFYFYILIEDLIDYTDRPRSTCEDINWWTPFLVGSQVFATLGCFFTGSFYITLYNIPMLLVHFHQYSRRVPDSDFGYHNPVRFFSPKHLDGLKSIFIIMAAYYLISIGIYCSSGVVELMLIQQ